MGGIYTYSTKWYIVYGEMFLCFLFYMLKVFFSLNDNHGYLMWNLWGKKFSNKHWKIICWMCVYGMGAAFFVGFEWVEFKVLHYTTQNFLSRVEGQSFPNCCKSQDTIIEKINILPHCMGVFRTNVWITAVVNPIALYIPNDIYVWFYRVTWLKHCFDDHVSAKW